MDISSCSEFFTALMGAIVGGLFVLFGTYMNNKCTIKIENRKSNLNLVSMLKSMNKEANLLVESGKDIISNLKKHDTENIFFYVTEITQNYFSIYDNNSHLLGQISWEENEEYINSIIEFYILAKRFLDTLASYSWYLNKCLEYKVYSNLTKEKMICVLSHDFDKKIRNINNTLKKYASGLESKLDNFNRHHGKYILHL